MRKTFTAIALLFFGTAPLFAQITNENVEQEFKNQLQKFNFKNVEEVSFEITSTYKTKHNKITHFYGNQVVTGLTVFNVNMDLHLNESGKTVAFHHNFIEDAQLSILNKGFKLSALDALSKALLKEGISITSSNSYKGISNDNGKQVWFDPNVSTEKMYAKQGLFFFENNLKAVYQIEFFQDETNDWFNMMVDANTGTILQQSSYTAHCNTEEIISNLESTKQLKTSEERPQYLGKNGSLGTYHSFPLPLESPNHGPRNLLSNKHYLPASPFGWHDTNAVVGPEFKITRGNNVHAKEDTLANNANGYSPNGGDSLIFDFPYSIDAKPRANLDAAITNLFYMNNALHDILFAYGFDEASGNFQQKNYSGVGRQLDAVMADAQDGSGTSNANFSTPVDGSSGRMQMFLWPTSGASANNNTLMIVHPNTIKGKFYAPQSAFGPKLNTTGFPGQIVLVKDSGATTNNGCGVIGNPSEINGKIALVDRGGPCGTQSSTGRTKIKKLQAAGAIAVIMAHNVSGTTPTSITGTDAAITIPSISVSFGTGSMLKTALLSDSIYAILFDSSAFNTARIYDSDLDNGVITHEYGHGVSNRLTGGPNNSNCLTNQEQSGEGWSDFFALAFTTREWHNGATISRGIGTFVVDEDTIGLGIRPYRYSRSMTVNPVNYNSVKTLSIPHGVGFVFCSMLYDIFWDMVDVYGFDPDIYEGKGGNNKTIQLVIDGLKLQPCNPGFVDSRDAILKADSINNGGVNKDLLWKAFARRGLGYSAAQGSANSKIDGVQAFDLPPAVGLPSQLLERNFNIYPNPAKNSLSIEVYGGASIQKTEIYDISGKLVQTKIASKTTFNHDEFGLNLISGVYFVKIYTNEGSASKKLIVE
jgi:hypothetical protein